MTRRTMFRSLILFLIISCASFLSPRRPQLAQQVGSANRGNLHLTPKEFQNLRLGMTEQEVIQHLGCSGTYRCRVTDTYFKDWRGGGVVISLHFSELFGEQIEGSWYGALEGGRLVCTSSGETQEVSADRNTAWMRRWQDQLPLPAEEPEGEAKDSGAS